MRPGRGMRFWRALLPVALASAVLVTCSTTGTATAPVASFLFAGDVMLGRGVAPIAAADPAGLFRDVRQVVREADFALANLESPLTTRPHVSANPNVLEADPALSPRLAAAGFDVLSLANNHSTDAGVEGLLDTITAVEAAGMIPVGAGVDSESASQARFVEVAGLEVAMAAFDATSSQERTGVADWEPITAQRVVEEAAARADLVLISIHGGVEYLPEADPRMARIAEQLTAWGADVVWGHGPHVVQPTTVTRQSAPGRWSVVATSLGNLLFDQRGQSTGKGVLLEVLADRGGVIAYRLGSTSHQDLRAHFGGWDLPAGDAGLIAGEWWSLARPMQAETSVDPAVEPFPWGHVVAAARGDVIPGGVDEIVVSFRHQPGPHPVREGMPGIDWVDTAGRSPHLGIYQAGDLTPLWVAGMVPAPIAAVAACDGAVALAYSTLDDDDLVGTGAATWHPFGLDATERLPGPGTPGCADLDADGHTDPVILDRPQQQVPLALLPASGTSRQFP